MLTLLIQACDGIKTKSFARKSARKPRGRRPCRKPRILVGYFDGNCPNGSQGHGGKTLLVGVYSVERIFCRHDNSVRNGAKTRRKRTSGRVAFTGGSAASRRFFCPARHRYPSSVEPHHRCNLYCVCTLQVSDAGARCWWVVLELSVHGSTNPRSDERRIAGVCAVEEELTRRRGVQGTWEEERIG
ncbi:hypothetical protein CSPX01_06992 [Colletotrichum filicis]|nr:hypothetical protein CSPX01_06992 [Colletotrichum filicis]